MQLQQPGTDAQVGCPSCGHAIGIGADGTIQSSRPLDSMMQLPPPDVLASQVFGADNRGSVSRSTSHTDARQRGGYRQQKKIQTGVYIAAVIAGLVTLLIVGFAVVLFVNRDAVQSYVPSFESHTEVLDESRQVVQQTQVLLLEPDKSPTAIGIKLSDEEVVKRIDKICGQVQQLTRRAAKLPPMTAVQYGDLQRSGTLREFAALHDKFDTATRSGNLLAAGEMRKRIDRLSFDTRNLESMLNMGWVPIAEPGSPTEKAERDSLLVYRDVWSSMYDISDSTDYQRLSRVFAHAVSQLESILSRYQQSESSGQLFSSGSPYQEALATFLENWQSRFRQLETQFGSLDQALSYQKLVEQQSNFARLQNSGS